MKVFRPVFLLVFAILGAMAFRAGIRRFFPRVYVYVWGSPLPGQTVQVSPVGQQVTKDKTEEMPKKPSVVVGGQAGLG